jgi:hypothetical protein
MWTKNDEEEEDEKRWFFNPLLVALCVYVMCVKAFEAVMAGRPGNDSKSTSPIFSFLFIFF